MARGSSTAIFPSAWRCGRNSISTTFTVRIVAHCWGVSWYPGASEDAAVSVDVSTFAARNGPINQSPRMPPPMMIRSVNCTRRGTPNDLPGAVGAGIFLAFTASGFMVSGSNDLCYAGFTCLTACRSRS